MKRNAWLQLKRLRCGQKGWRRVFSPTRSIWIAFTSMHGHCSFRMKNAVPRASHNGRKLSWRMAATYLRKTVKERAEGSDIGRGTCVTSSVAWIDRLSFPLGPERVEQPSIHRYQPSPSPSISTGQDLDSTFCNDIVTKT